jgi:uncharacterized protein (TIGR02284 family)
MHMNNNEVVSILNRLIKTCRNGEETFKTAADNIRNSEFRRLFNIFSQQRAQFVSELEAEVHRLGGTASRHETTSDTVQRSWGNVRSIVVREEAKVIADCQHEEETAVNDYQEALKADLPLDVQYVVKRQYMDIKDAYDRMRILQRAA